MSYDISNYVFKGVPLDEFIDCLDDDKLLSLSKWEHQQVSLLLVDENLINCLNDILGSSEFKYGKNSFKTEDVAKALVHESFGQSGILVDGKDTGIQGIKELLVRAIFTGCGISSEDLKPNPDTHQTCSSSMDLSEMTGWPFLQRNGDNLAHGAIEIPDELDFFCDIATKKLNWSYEADPKMDQESYEWKSPEFKYNLKKILGWVKSTDEKNDDDWMDHDYWREQYCSVLINRALKFEDHYIEEEDSSATEVSVQSTRFGGVHDSGGMESNVLYLSVSGDMDTYDEEGWYDPEKETPLAFKKTKEILFGDENYDLNKYTPQFGG